MKRRRKRRASPAPLICLLAVLACIVALRISVSEETAASAQMTGKLEKPATTAPVRLLEVEMTEAEQVTRAEDRPARAARYVNIEMTDEELAELAAVVPRSRQSARRGAAGRCRSRFQPRATLRFPGLSTRCAAPRRRRRCSPVLHHLRGQHRDADASAV